MEGAARSDGRRADGDDGAAPAIAGLLLTGGSSRRMGLDKSTLVIDGEPLAARVARVLRAVCPEAVEVGPGVTGLPHTLEAQPGAGPLAAIAAGWSMLRGRGHVGPVLVVACDLPLLDDHVLGRLAGWPGAGSVVPVAGGLPQPLCARWSVAALDAATSLLATTRSVRHLVGMDDVTLVDAEVLGAGPGGLALRDVDRPGDLAELGLTADGIPAQGQRDEGGLRARVG